MRYKLDCCRNVDRGPASLGRRGNRAIMNENCTNLGSRKRVERPGGRGPVVWLDGGLAFSGFQGVAAPVGQASTGQSEEFRPPISRPRDRKAKAQRRPPSDQAFNGAALGTVSPGRRPGSNTTMTGPCLDEGRAFARKRW